MPRAIVTRWLARSVPRPAAVTGWQAFRRFAPPQQESAQRASSPRAEHPSRPTGTNLDCPLRPAGSTAWSGRNCNACSSIFVLALLVTLQIASTAWAWGRLGHRVISRIAKKNLTPSTRDAIAELLEPGETIADASTWADEHRRQLPKTAPWHYVDVPLDEPRYDSKWSTDDPNHGCVVDKINQFKATLKDKTKSV
jgi:hypothetical protein